MVLVRHMFLYLAAAVAAAGDHHHHLDIMASAIDKHRILFAKTFTFLTGLSRCKVLM